MSEPNLYDAGFKDGLNVGYDAGFKEAQAKLKSMAMDSIAADLSSEVSADRIKELEERLKAATDDAKEAEAYAEEIYAHAKELETKLDRASKMLPRALSAVYKNRKQEVIDVLETAIAELTGGKDD